MPFRTHIPVLALALTLVGAPTALAAPPVTTPAPEVGSTEVALAELPSAELSELSDLPEEVASELETTSDLAVETASQPLTDEVAVAALILPADADPASLWVRSTADGQPEAWEQIQIDPTDDGQSGTVSSEPVIISSKDEVEAIVVSADGEPVGAELQVYSSVVTAADATASATASSYAWDNPRILSRAAWGADESLVRYGYSRGEVTGAMIHHTAGTNSYTSAQVPAILRSIQAFHVNGRGWNDTAYNVLVDKFGRAWEGRGGGVNQPIAGGHAWGVTNRRVFGISLMGNYETATPSSAMIETMNQVIAWKLQMHNVNPYGSTWGSGGQDGGSTFLPAISGHRDENATSCPGRYVYSRMGTIRSRVQTLMNTTRYPRFRDVPIGLQFEPEIRWMATTGISTGWSDGTYRPWEPVTREAMAAFLYRMAGSPAYTPPATSPFSDVPTSHMYYKEIAWLAATRVAEGYPDGTFRPAATTNRDAMAAYLYRMYNRPSGTGTVSYNDIARSNQFYREIAWLTQRGIATGYPDGSFRPTEPVRRDAMAAFMNRSVSKLGTPRPQG
ncbi:S-layer homology domain-containing protein [Propioniciclava soli]|uniref:S-layer homology domain-containing protein n=1 Tax=Propioniciclava soli TaxID=2775081 RepID=A0ABZ3C850_9ACTN